jgi:hypothetical protein
LSASSVLTADLDRRRRKRCHEKCARYLVDRARELLGEREGGVERASGQVVFAPLEPGIGDPFVNEHDDRRVRGKEGAQGVRTGRDTGPVGFRNGPERP